MKVVIISLAMIMLCGPLFAQATKFVEDGVWHWMDLSAVANNLVPAKEGDIVVSTQIYVIANEHLLALRCFETEETYTAKNGNLIPRRLDYGLAVRHDITPPNDWNGVIDVLYSNEGGRIAWKTVPTYIGRSISIPLNGPILSGLLNSNSPAIQIRFSDTEIGYEFPLEGIGKVFNRIRCRE